MKKLILAFTALVQIQTFARDHDRQFRRGPGHTRGNERTERPGRVSTGPASHSGNGCPQGTMRVTFAPDLLSFTVLYDQFVAQISAGQRGNRDVMNCDALIPIQLPDGMRMEITRVDFRGFAGLPAGARGLLHSILNFRGRGGDGDRINLRYQFDGPSMDNYLISTDALNEASETSPCGGTTVLRVGTQLSIVSPKQQNATLTLDSVDASSHAIYYVNWRRCQ